MTKPKKLAHSGRGGRRDDAGRPAKWKHTPTTVIRVPEPLLNQIMVYAHELDNGVVQNQIAPSEQLIEIITKWQGKSKNTRNWTECNKLLQELQNIITTTNS
jgi:TRAP-type mannitol/chloroaromatic compound transport system substrate-binding protein